MRSGLIIFSVVALAFTGLGTTAHAQRADDVPKGDLLIFRDVGPRNAIHPTNGEAHTVTVAPNLAFSSVVGSALTPISDIDAASVAAGPGLRPIQDTLDPIFGQTFGATSGEAAVRISGGGSGGISGTINSALNSGLGAMRGALGCVKGC